MKKIFLITVLFFIAKISFSQTIQTRPSGMGFLQQGNAAYNTWVQTNGIGYDVVGRVLAEYSDTSAANSALYPDLAAGIMIRVGNKVYFRSAALNAWIELVNGASSLSVPINNLWPATGTNSIDNTTFGQVWNWSGAVLGALQLARSTTTAQNSGYMLALSLSGAHGSSGIESFGLDISNAHSGTTSTNIAARFSATNATNNYAIIVPSSGGSVGIGTSSPQSIFHVFGASAFRYTDGQQAAGRLLVSDAGGIATWQSAIVLPNSIGAGIGLSNSALTSGTILDITGTSTVLAAGNEGLNIAISGANGTNGITATGARISVTNTNGTSGTNNALDLTASGATTANNALNIAAGAIALNGSAGNSGQVLTSAGASTLPTWTTPATGTIGGSIANTQVAVGDAANSIAGSANLVWNGTSFNIGAGTASANNGLIVRSPTNVYYEGAIVYANNLSANTQIGYAGLRTSGAMILTPGTTGHLDGSFFVGGQTAPTAKLHLVAGTTAASTAPLKFTSGSLLTAAEAGAVEFLTDKWYGTITTGAARKEFTLNDAALTSTHIPFATTNGRLTSSANLTWSGTALTVQGNIENTVAGLPINYFHPATEEYGFGQVPSDNFLRQLTMVGAGYNRFEIGTGGGNIVIGDAYSQGNQEALWISDSLAKLAYGTYDAGIGQYPEIKWMEISAGGTSILGDVDNSASGAKFNITPGSDLAYFDNTAHTIEVGINTATPAASLDVVGTFQTSGVNTLSNLAGTGSRAVLADANGVLSAPVSDRSLKEKIKNLDSGIGIIKKLRPVNFFYKKDWQNYGTRQQIGFIAQEVQKVMPNSVFENKDGKLGFSVTDMIPVLVKAVQEQQEIIERLRKEIDKLKKKKK